MEHWPRKLLSVLFSVHVWKTKWIYRVYCQPLPFSCAYECGSVFYLSFFSYSVQSFIASWSLSSPSWAACCCNGLSSPCQDWYHHGVSDCPWWWWCPMYSSSKSSIQPNSESLRTEKSLHVLCLPYFSESLCWNTQFLCDVTRGIHDRPLPLSCFEIIMLLPHFQICGRSNKASF